MSESKKRRITPELVASPSSKSPLTTTSSAFRLENVVRGGTTMRGIVAARDVPAWTLIGTYAGQKLHRQYLEQSRFKNKTEAEKDQLAQYDIADPRDDNYVISPVDEQGRLLPEYANVAVLYINEASDLNEFPNVVIWHDFNKITFWTYKNVLRGNELLTYYGNEYHRQYPIWWVDYMDQDIATQLVLGPSVNQDDQQQEKEQQEQEESSDVALSDDLQDFVVPDSQF